MTRKELAAFKRLDKRRDRLFSALCIINAWLALPDNWHNISKLVTECIMDEKAAQAKEGETK